MFKDLCKVTAVDPDIAGNIADFHIGKIALDIGHTVFRNDDFIAEIAPQ